jgi:hypothetical protein
MNDDFKAIEKRTVRSFYDDGLTELVIGVILFLLGGYFYIRSGRGGDPRVSLNDTAFFLIVIFAVLLANSLLRFLKRRITYPRAGYVSYRKEVRPSRRWIAGASGAIIAVLLSALTAISPSAKAWDPAIYGFLLAVTFLMLAAKVGAPRFFVLAVISAALGTGIAAAGIISTRGAILYGTLLGAALALSGVIALIQFLRRNKRSAEGPDGL